MQASRDKHNNVEVPVNLSSKCAFIREELLKRSNGWLPDRCRPVPRSWCWQLTEFPGESTTYAEHVPERSVRGLERLVRHVDGGRDS